ncbi:MAG: hypothetical protein ACTHJ7_04370 [Candidatus Nitrosocosmicus sp.]
MSTKNVLSIVVIILITAMFISSSTFVNPLFAKTTSNTVDKKGPTTTTTSSPSSTFSSSTENDYKEFQKCLSGAEGTKGFATNQEIKDCYNPIYRPLATTTSTSSMDFSRPHITNTQTDGQ